MTPALHGHLWLHQALGVAPEPRRSRHLGSPAELSVSGTGLLCLLPGRCPRPPASGSLSLSQDSSSCRVWACPVSSSVSSLHGLGSLPLWPRCGLNQVLGFIPTPWPPEENQILPPTGPLFWLSGCSAAPCVKRLSGLSLPPAVSLFPLVTRSGVVQPHTDLGSDLSSLSWTHLGVPRFPCL